MKGIKAGVEVVQSARLSQELQRICLPTNPGVIDIVQRNTDSQGGGPKTYRVESSDLARSLLASQSSLGDDNAYGDKPYEAAGPRAIGKGRSARYEVSQPGLSHAKASAPSTTGQHSGNPGNHALLQLNSQLVSPSSSSNNPLKKRLTSDLVPLSTIGKLPDPFYSATTSAKGRSLLIVNLFSFFSWTR